MASPPEPPRPERKLTWALTLMVFSCLAAVLAASVAAYMAMVVLRQAQTLQVRHDNFCTFLATEISAASTPTLRPLVPALRAEHTNNACP